MSTKREVFVFIGPPGSGKGTISQLCVQKLGWKQLSTGNLCRQHIEKRTEIGAEIDFAIKSGKLVSDALITRMVFDWFVKNSHQDSAVILDGFPRTVVQAQALFEQADSDDFDLSMHVVRFSLDDQKILERLERRYVCKNSDCQKAYAVYPGSKLAPKTAGICDDCGHEIGRRKDDLAQTIKERLKVYRQHEQKLLDFCKDAGYAVHELSTDQPIEHLFDQFKAQVGESDA